MKNRTILKHPLHPKYQKNMRAKSLPSINCKTNKYNSSKGIFPKLSINIKEVSNENSINKIKILK